MQSLERRRLLVAAAVASAGALVSAAAGAQAAWPARPVRLYVGYPAGGGTDVIARLIAAKLTDALGQQVVVMNLPGATGAIALERVVQSPADGYTLVVISAADTILPALRAKLPFDLARDLVPVAPAATGALTLVVTPSLPARNVKELIALAQSQPGRLNFASPGIGNSQHLAGEVFNVLARTQIQHVPFKGGAEALNATIAGETQMVFASLSAALPLVQGGKLRLLAVTPATRASAVPDVPTLAEAGVPGYSRSTWFGVAAPAGTPRDIVGRVNAALAQGLHDAATREALRKLGLEPMAAAPEAFATFVAGEIAGNTKLVRELGIKPE